MMEGKNAWTLFSFAWSSVGSKDIECEVRCHVSWIFIAILLGWVCYFFVLFWQSNLNQSSKISEVRIDIFAKKYCTKNQVLYFLRWLKSVELCFGLANLLLRCVLQMMVLVDITNLLFALAMLLKNETLHWLTGGRFEMCCFNGCHRESLIALRRYFVVDGSHSYWLFYSLCVPTTSGLFRSMDAALLIARSLCWARCWELFVLVFSQQLTRKAIANGLNKCGLFLSLFRISTTR